MACCPTEKSYGYDSNRFEKDVDEHFHCSICYNVLKEPRTCRNNDHMFCLDCITEHLEENSQTCPECNDHLSVDTLRRPRVVNNYLSELKINCDYVSRGCPEFVRVVDLKTHVENCGFAPVICSNEECCLEINKQDKVHHEIEACEYKKMKCHECGEIQEVVRRLEQKIMELDRKVEAAREGTRQEIGDVRKKMKEVNEKVGAATRTTKKEVEGVKKEVQYVEENISKVKKDVEEVKVMMSQLLQKLDMLELFSKLPSPSEGMMNTLRKDILIAGGNGTSKNVGQSTEIYSWEKNGWFEMSGMNEEHVGASLFIYKDQLLLVGGENSKIIERLDLKELPLKWVRFPGELPYPCDDHQTVAHQ